MLLLVYALQRACCNRVGGKGDEIGEAGDRRQGSRSTREGSQLWVGSMGGGRVGAVAAKVAA